MAKLDFLVRTVVSCNRIHYAIRLCHAFSAHQTDRLCAYTIETRSQGELLLLSLSLFLSFSFFPIHIKKVYIKVTWSLDYVNDCIKAAESAFYRLGARYATIAATEASRTG